MIFNVITADFAFLSHGGITTSSAVLVAESVEIVARKVGISLKVKQY